MRLVGPLVLTEVSPVSPSTRQHLVDAQHVERMETYPQVELIFAAVLHHVLVGTDAAGLESLAGQLLILVRYQVYTEGEIVHRGLLSTKVIDSDLCIWVKRESEDCAHDHVCS